MVKLTEVEDSLQKFVAETVAAIESLLRDSPYIVYQSCFALHRRLDDKDNVITMFSSDGGGCHVFRAPEFCEVSPDMVFHLLCVQLYKAGYKERPQSACVEDGYPALAFNCLDSNSDTPALLLSVYSKMTSYMIGNSTEWRKRYTVYLRQPNEGQVFYMFCCRPDKDGVERSWVVASGIERSWEVETDNADSVDTRVVEMAMLMLNKGYQVRRLYSAPAGLTIDMNQCRRLLEFTAVLDSRESKNSNN